LAGGDPGGGAPTSGLGGEPPTTPGRTRQSRRLRQGGGPGPGGWKSFSGVGEPSGGGDADCAAGFTVSGGGGDPMPAKPDQPTRENKKSARSRRNGRGSQTISAGIPRRSGEGHRLGGNNPFALGISVWRSVLRAKASSGGFARSEGEGSCCRSRCQRDQRTGRLAMAGVKTRRTHLHARPAGTRLGVGRLAGESTRAPTAAPAGRITADEVDRG